MLQYTSSNKRVCRTHKWGLAGVNSGRGKISEISMARLLPFMSIELLPVRRNHRIRTNTVLFSLTIDRFSFPSLGVRGYSSGLESPCSWPITRAISSDVPSRPRIFACRLVICSIRTAGLRRSSAGLSVWDLNAEEWWTSECLSIYPLFHPP